MKGSELGMRTRRNIVQLSTCIGAHQLDRRRVHRGEPAQRVDHDREEAEHCRYRHLRDWVQQSEPVVRDRCEGDDRHRVCSDRERHERCAEPCGSERGPSRDDPESGPIANPPGASWSVYRPACHSSVRLSQNAVAMSMASAAGTSARSDAVVSPCQRAIPSRKTTSAGSQSRSRRPTTAPSPAGIGSMMVLVRRSPARSWTSVRRLPAPRARR